jgi:hypothetical protein
MRIRAPRGRRTRSVEGDPSRDAVLGMVRPSSAFIVAGLRGNPSCVTRDGPDKDFLIISSRGI